MRTARGYQTLVKSGFIAMLWVSGCGDDNNKSAATDAIQTDTSQTITDSTASDLNDTNEVVDTHSSQPNDTVTTVDNDATIGNDTQTTTTIAPGGACGCDSDCESTGVNDGVCINGICMQLASTDCSADGSSVECSAGSRCWQSICFPDCASFDCAGGCDGDGSCVWSDASTCDDSCSAYCVAPYNGDPAQGNCPDNAHEVDGSCYCNDGFTINAEQTGCVFVCESTSDCSDFSGTECIDGTCQIPPCTENSCGEGMICAESGKCVVNIGQPPAGPVPDCSHIAGWECIGSPEYCNELITFDPRVGYGYDDYPVNGEPEANQYRSYLARQGVLLIKYATDMTMCLSQNWDFGTQMQLGLGDMSEADGSIPGTSIGSPGHPEGTHVDGKDIDIAYYQTAYSANNYLRAVCDHVTNGADQYHCVGEPELLDPWRTGLFIALLHHHSRLRVIGVDGKIGPIVESAMSSLCESGYVQGQGCVSPSQDRLTYEVENQGWGWYSFHHHHLHVSLLPASATTFAMPQPLPEGAFPIPNEHLGSGCGLKPKGR